MKRRYSIRVHARWDVPFLATPAQVADMRADGLVIDELAAHKPDGGDAKDADPLQGAADWLVAALAKPRPTEIAARLLIGYNRAERLYDAAISAQQRQGDGGE